MLDFMNSSANVFGGSDNEQQWSNETKGEQVFGPNSEYHGLENFGNSIKEFFSNLGDWWKNSALNPGTWQKKIQDMLGITNIKDSINNAASQGKIAYTESGIPYDATNIDSQINAKMTELAYKRDDESYDRLIAALKRNGINPVLALSNSASPMSSASGYRSNYSLTDKDQVNSALKVGMIIALLMKVLK